MLGIPIFYRTRTRYGKQRIKTENEKSEVTANENGSETGKEEEQGGLRSKGGTFRKQSKLEEKQQTKARLVRHPFPLGEGDYTDEGMVRKVENHG